MTHSLLTRAPQPLPLEEDLLRPLVSLLLTGVFAFAFRKLTAPWGRLPKHIALAGVLEWAWLAQSSALGPRFVPSATHPASSAFGVLGILLILAIWFRAELSWRFLVRVLLLAAAFTGMRAVGMNLSAPMNLLPGLGLLVASLHWHTNNSVGSFRASSRVLPHFSRRTTGTPSSVVPGSAQADIESPPSEPLLDSADAVTDTDTGKSGNLPAIALLSVATVFMGTFAAVHRSSLDRRDERFVTKPQAILRTRLAPWDAKAWLASAWAFRGKADADRARSRELLKRACLVGCKDTDTIELESELSALTGDCEQARALHDQFVLMRAKQQFEEIDVLKTQLKLQEPRVPPSLSEFCPRPSLLLGLE